MPIATRIDMRDMASDSLSRSRRGLSRSLEVSRNHIKTSLVKKQAMSKCRRDPCEDHPSSVRTLSEKG
jgi:hypothetical protein